MKPRQVIGNDDLPGFLLLCNVRFEIALYGQEIYINRQSKIGRKMAGTRFMILIFDATSIFSPNATMSREPTQVISAITLSLSRGASNPAAREIVP